MAKVCSVCERTFGVGDKVEPFICDECLERIDKMQGISTNYYDKLTNAENHKQMVLYTTYMMLKDDAFEKGFRHIADLAYALNQKSKNAEDEEMKSYYKEKMNAVLKSAKEVTTKEEYEYIVEEANTLI